MKSQDLFLLSDKAIQKANRKIATRFSKAKTSLLSIDEVNALDADKVIKKLYKSLKKDFYSLLKDLGSAQYAKAGDRLKRALEDDFVELFIIYGYDPVTGYVLDNEIDRKQQRTSEQIIAEIEAGIGVAESMRKAATYMAAMFAQEADNTTLAVTIQAFRDMGVTKVKWVTQHDEKVCKICIPRDGKIYSIDKIPNRHWNCRCLLEPVD